MNIPNKLTVVRLVLTVGFICFMLRPDLLSAVLALAFFLLAAVTDFLDGHYARKLGQVSDFGKIMDPLADKFLMLAGFYMFSRMGMVAWWMFLAILAREIGVSAYRFVAMGQGRVLAAEKAGKYKTVLQIVTIVAMLLFIIFNRVVFGPLWGIKLMAWQGIQLLLWMTVLLTVFSGVSYFWNNRRLNGASS